MMVESLENRALMSATLGGEYLSQPPAAGSTAMLLPAVQKVREAASQPNGIIAVLIGL